MVIKNVKKERLIKIILRLILIKMQKKLIYYQNKSN